MSAALVEFSRRAGIRVSGLQFIFWFLLLICGIPQLHGQLRRQTFDYKFISYILFHCLSSAIWGLNCCVDNEPVTLKYLKPIVSVRDASIEIGI